MKIVFLARPAARILRTIQSNKSAPENCSYSQLTRRLLVRVVSSIFSSIFNLFLSFEPKYDRGLICNKFAFEITKNVP